MKRKSHPRARRSPTKSVLRLPDLEQAKAAVLNSLTSPDAQRGYRHAIDEFVDWYCSEPRLAFNRTVVLRYRSHLESRQLAPGTINLRLGSTRQRGEEAGHSPRQLVNGRTRQCALASARSSATERKTRPSLACIVTRVWVEKA